MAHFLAKTDPETYSLDDLEREGRTVWDGVRNPQALKAIREMRPGDTVLIYHSGADPGIVGRATVLSEPRTDPRDPKSVIVDLAFASRIEPRATLAEIKQTGRFNDWSLVRQGRLSTMGVPDDFVAWLNDRSARRRTAGRS